MTGRKNDKKDTTRNTRRQLRSAKRRQSVKPTLSTPAEVLEERKLLSAVTVDVHENNDAAESQSLAAASNEAVSTINVGTSGSTANIAWNGVNGATRYQLFVANLDNGQAVVNQFVAGTSFQKSSLTSGNYRVWVRGFDDYGNATAWSSPVDFQIAGQRLNPPTVTGPSGSTTDATPRITWTGSSGAVRYQVFVSNLGTGQAVANNTVATTSFTPRSDWSGGQYRVWVRAIDGQNNASAWSASQDFQISTRLVDPPSLTGPSSSTSDKTPTITWNGVSGAVRYQVFVANLDNGQAVANSQVTGTSFTPSSNWASGRYRAWVRAIDAQSNATAWSSYRDFEIAAAVVVVPPQLTGPASTTSDATPTITWNGVNGAVRYQVFVANIGTGQAVANSQVTGTSFTPTSNWAAGQYRVWVRAIDAQSNATGWSTPRDFTIGSVQLGVPQLTGPSSTTNDATPTITWTAANGAVRYQVFVANVRSGQAVANTTVTGTSFTSTSNWANGQYRIWVRAVDAQANVSAWSSTRDFQINAGPNADADNVLYINFDGASLTAQDVQRYARDWKLGYSHIDGDNNGVQIQAFMQNQANRETVIAGILQRVQQDFAQFGVVVRRHTGKAVEGVGASTIFVGNANYTSTAPGIAGDVDQRNNNVTDIAFAREILRSTVGETISRMSQLVAHEAGHTYGLMHTNVYQNGQVYPDIMGINYTNGSLGLREPSPYPDVRFVDRSFEEFFVTQNGQRYGHGFDSNRTEYQNPVQTLRVAFNGSVFDRAGGELAGNGNAHHDHDTHEETETVFAVFSGMTDVEDDSTETDNDGKDQVVVKQSAKFAAVKANDSSRDDRDEMSREEKVDQIAADSLFAGIGLDLELTESVFDGASVM